MRAWLEISEVPHDARMMNTLQDVNFAPQLIVEITRIGSTACWHLNELDTRPCTADFATIYHEPGCAIPDHLTALQILER
eukprot:55492-Eustigmatos_ZCMA.PRE.1